MWVRRTVVIGGSIFAVVALVAGATFAWGLWSLNSLRRVDLDLAQAAEDEPQNFLLIGSDSRANVDEDAPGAGVMSGKGAPGGRRADSIAVVRIDPSNERVDMLSIPRDLWLPIAGTGEEQRINTAYSQSTQAVVDTVQNNLGVPINHFVEVDFQGFQDLVEALGGVPLYFDHPVRDKNSGLRVDKRGCSVLDGFQGLAFARSRHLEWSNGSKWVSDPTADLGRITRQQVLMRAALAQMSGMGLDDVTKLKSLVDAGLDNVALDSNMGNGDIIELARKFSDFDPQRLQTHSLTVTPHETAGGAAVVLLDPAASAPTLELFKGSTPPPTVTTTTAPPPAAGDVTVSVFNATPKQGEARRVSFVLSTGDFGIGQVDSAPAADETTIGYPAKGKAMAELVAAWMSPTPKLVEDKDLAPGSVKVTVGADFQKIAEPSDGDTSTSSSSSSSTVPPSTNGTAPVTTAPPEIGWTPGAAPPGVTC